MDISIDSRTIKKGQYYIPVKGKNYDGRAFIKEAIQKGGILLDVPLQEYAKQYRKKLTATVIGITGSAGKTTCKEMLAAMLAPYVNVVKTKDNQNNEIGVPLTLLKADFQTDIILVEMGIRKKEDMLPLVQICRPTISIITSIHMSHMQFFSTLKEIAIAKSKIFHPPLHNEAHPRTAFIDKQCKFNSLLQKRAKQTGYTVKEFTGNTTQDSIINLCYLVGRSTGLTDEQISKGLQTFKPQQQRLQKTPHPNITLIDDTYNANPGSVLYALNHLHPIYGRKLVILGDMCELGAYTKNAYDMIIKKLETSCITLFITYGSIMPQPTNTISHIHFENKEELHLFLQKEIKPKDTVLIKGSRAMKMEETIQYIQENIHV